MSFILDALKKSETDRQQRSTAEFAGIPTSSGRREGPPAWLWVIGVLLLVNFAVLAAIFLRPETSPPEPVAVAQPVSAPESSTDTDEDFADQVAAARENAPRREAPPQETAVSPSPTPARPATVTVVSEPVSTAALPTIHEVRANGAVTIPDLHVDIHVYSEAAADRFVFINMTKHNEGSRLTEGPLVEEITPDGVVLSMNGISFLLPRD